MNKCIITFALFLSLIGFKANSQDNYTPDFAFPETVIIHSDSSINAALKSNNSVDLIKYLIQYSIAQSNISNDNLQLIVNKIDSVIDIENNICSRNILFSFKAVVLNRYLSANRYMINKRNFITPILSSDITEWSLPQFQEVIIHNLNKSLENKDITSRITIPQYKSFLSITN